MSRFDRWIFEEYRTPHQSLAIYRILYALMMLIIFVPRGLWLNKAPDAFYNPPISLPAFFTAPPPDAFMVGLNVLAAVSLVMLLIGWHTVFASLATALLELLLCSWEQSLGKINHGVVMVLVPFVLAFSGWGKAFSLDAGESASDLDQDPDNLRGSWAVTMMAFLIGLMMFTAGWQKLRSGWADPSLFATQGHLAKHYHVIGRETWAGEMLLASDSWLLWKSADWGVMALECGFLIAPFRRKLFVVFCAVATLFHVGVMVMFSINFWISVITYGAVLDWSRLLVLRIGGFRASRRIPYIVGAVALIMAWILIFVVEDNFQETFAIPVSTIVLWLAAVVGATYLHSTVMAAVRPRPSAALRDPPVIFFDGECGFCNSWINFMLLNDRAQVFRYSALQSDYASRTLTPLGIACSDLSSVVLLESGRAYLRSSAILRSARHLDYPLSALYLLTWIPRPLRDLVYWAVARTRNRLWKNSTRCRALSPEESKLFIE